MPDSMVEQLQRDMECEGLLECIHGLKQLDRECYKVLVASEEPLTIDEVGERVDRARSTAYRSIQRLLRAGFVRKDQVNYDGGGYYHVYYPADPAGVATDMRRMLDDWYAKMDRLIREYEEEYGEDPGDVVPADG